MPRFLFILTVLITCRTPDNRRHCRTHLPYGHGRMRIVLNFNGLFIGAEVVTIAVTPTPHVILIGLVLMVAVGLVAGFASAWRSSRTEIVPALRAVGQPTFGFLARTNDRGPVVRDGATGFSSINLTGNAGDQFSDTATVPCAPGCDSSRRGDSTPASELRQKFGIDQTDRIRRKRYSGRGRSGPRRMQPLRGSQLLNEKTWYFSRR